MSSSFAAAATAGESSDTKDVASAGPLNIFQFPAMSEAIAMRGILEGLRQLAGRNRDDPGKVTSLEQLE